MQHSINLIHGQAAFTEAGGVPQLIALLENK